MSKYDKEQEQCPHRCACEHKRVQYCAKCRVVHCLDCKQEWTERVTTQPYYYPRYSQPWTLGGNTWCGGQTLAGSLSGQIATFGSGTVCDHAAP